jgi:hypothetical protein
MFSGMAAALYARALLVTSLLFVALLSPLLRAEDWTTTYGRVYHDVTVIKVEPDAITILHHDGGALVPLGFLPADLQKRFKYDPVKAQAYADERAKSDADNAKALEVEMAEAKKLQAAQDAKYKADKDAAVAWKKAQENGPSQPGFGTPDFLDPNQHTGGSLLAPMVYDQNHYRTGDALAKDPSLNTTPK